MDAIQLPPILQGKVNASKYPEKVLTPSLITILSEASHFNPNFTYVASDTHFNGGALKISEVAVYERAHPVGVISVDERYSRRGNRDTVYSVKAEGIERKRSNVHTTKHLKQAMKTIKDSFKPKQYDERADELRTTVVNKVERLARHADTHLQGLVRGAYAEVIAFLMEYDSLDPKPAQLPSKVTQKMGSNWRTYVDNNRIAESVHKNFIARNGACVRIEEDGTLSVLDLASGRFNEHASTYDLPTYYQEKITILKVMDENQPVEGVGARFESYDNTNGVRRDMQYFFLVGGETRTTC